MSIIALPSDRWPLSCSHFLLYICTALLFPLFFCHPLCCLSLTISLHLSVYLSITFFSIPLSFFQPLSFLSLCFLSSSACSVFPSPPQICPSLPFLLIPPKPSPHILVPSVLSVPFCRHYLWHQSRSAVPACLSSHHLSLHFLLVLEALRWDPARWRPSARRSDRAEYGCNTGSGHWHWHSPVSGYGGTTRQPNRQPAFTLCL